MSKQRHIRVNTLTVTLALPHNYYTLTWTERSIAQRKDLTSNINTIEQRGANVELFISSLEVLQGRGTSNERTDKSNGRELHDVMVFMYEMDQRDADEEFFSVDSEF